MNQASTDDAAIFGPDDVADDVEKRNNSSSQSFAFMSSNNESRMPQHETSIAFGSKIVDQAHPDVRLAPDYRPEHGKVLHVRNIPKDMKRGDLINFVSPYANPVKIIGIFPSQSLLEFETPAAAALVLSSLGDSLSFNNNQLFMSQSKFSAIDKPLKFSDARQFLDEPIVSNTLRQPRDGTDQTRQQPRRSPRRRSRSRHSRSRHSSSKSRRSSSSSSSSSSSRSHSNPKFSSVPNLFHQSIESIFPQPPANSTSQLAYFSFLYARRLGLLAPELRNKVCVNIAKREVDGRLKRSSSSSGDVTSSRQHEHDDDDHSHKTKTTHITPYNNNREVVDRSSNSKPNWSSNSDDKKIERGFGNRGGSSYGPVSSGAKSAYAKPEIDQGKYSSSRNVGYQAPFK